MIIVFSKAADLILRVRSASSRAQLLLQRKAADFDDLDSHDAAICLIYMWACLQIPGIECPCVDDLGARRIQDLLKDMCSEKGAGCARKGQTHVSDTRHAHTGRALTLILCPFLTLTAFPWLAGIFTVAVIAIDQRTRGGWRQWKPLSVAQVPVTKSDHDHRFEI